MKAIHSLTALGLCCVSGPALAQIPVPRGRPPAQTPAQEAGPPGAQSPVPQSPVPQGPAVADDALRVFLDCSSCDGEFIRREITYVNWVRDRADADVHLIITSQSTGSGGQEFTLRYIGQRAFSGTDDQLRFATRQSDTEDEIRRHGAQRIALGLVRYIARGANADRLQVVFAVPAGESEASAAQNPHDPWNLWVFRLSGSGALNGESQSKFSSYDGGFSIKRVAEAWKFKLSGDASRENSSYTLSDSSIYKSHSSKYNSSVLLVRSLSDHWSLGMEGSAKRSTHDNYRLNLTVMPELEFNVFPYKQSSDRQLVFVYGTGLSQANYADTTIYNRLKETLPYQKLLVAADATQPWGSLNAQLSAASLLNDFSKNRLTVDVNFSVRVMRGLDLSVNGGFSRVRDQLSLLKEGASDTEILLQLKQLKTGYYYYSGLELSYTFGSQFNNVVNPRFTH